ncbi:ABC transporter ATP-binding protein [Alteribacter lacisalsi]|uniref:Carnitine transport ATP-binding protein OpuCA n=1 Tax=Alteribacter lacisalsi TaxID=2045244 RepID=A0A2W0HJM9_9BACI|nr:ABC transporter ATP-binding protein [Alteribacter lacisalsi]PYZ97262.1 ABC transporter ATP-binding protein [Alteribacter lacisalsi]
MPFLDIKRLTKYYHEEAVFRDVSMRLEKGDILSLVGPSGTGKSTFLRCLAGLEQGTSGQIIIEGRDMTNVKAEKRPVVLMFQQPLLFPHMTVLENVTYGLRIRGIRKKALHEKGRRMLGKVSLSDYADRYPSECSGGQQQRIALARALIIKPELLLLDEPFSSLDEQLRRSLRSWVRELLKEENMTSIFVTHDREEAVFIGDRLAIMDGGSLVQIGKTNEVTNAPVSSRVSTLAGDGLNLGYGFVPAEDIQMVTAGNDPGAEFAQIDGVIERVWHMHGVRFAEVRTRRHSVNIHSPSEVSEGEQVNLVWKKGACRPFKLEKDDNDA